MLAKYGALGVAQQPFKVPFRLWNRLTVSSERREKVGHFGNLPADINGRNKIEAVSRQTFRLLIFEILDALIEFIHLLNWPWHPPFEAGFGILPAHFPECRHDRDFGFANLECKQQ